MKYFLSGFVAILTLAGVGLYYINTHTDVAAEPTPTAQVAEQPQPKPLPNIIVESPTPQQEVSSTLEVIGRAKGSWFFEGSFPITLKDEAGNEVVQGIASTSEEWMTLDYVPFIATLDLTGVTPGQYLIELKKDNPSGEPQNDESTTVPVVVK